MGRIAYERLESGHLVVPMTIGEHRLECVVDTGASLSIVTPETAHRLGLVEDAAQTVEGKGAGGDLGGIAVHVLDAITLAGAVVEEVEVAVADLSHIERKLGRALPGIIGANLLTRFVVEIDFSDRWIALHGPGAAERGELDTTDLAAEPFGAFDVVPGLMRFEPRMAGQRVEAVFDLGAARTVVNRAAARLVVPDVNRLRRANPPLLGANQTPIDARDMTCPSVSVAGVELGPCSLCVAELPVFAVLGMGGEGVPAMIFGLEPLMGRRLVIDYDAELLYVSR